MSHTQNMYKVGDYVYFETPENAPYQIRRIEDLNKTPSGQVEARVTLYYRRRDISSALLRIADQAERREQNAIKCCSYFKFLDYEEDKPKPGKFGSAGHTIANGADVNVEEISTDHKSSLKDDDDHDNRFEWGSAGLPLGVEKLNDSLRHRMRQRELFLSRRIETLPATLIRGKCQVTLLSEVETVSSYEGEDKFFYSLVYDPCQLTLLADKGAIRVGDKYQADVPSSMECDDRKENGDGDDLIIDDEERSGSEITRTACYVPVETERETLVYHPHHSLTDRDMDQFLIVARAVGTFSRALDTSSSTKLPSLHMTAAAASRDVTLLHAMALLHQADYDIGQAVKYLVPPPNKNYYPLEADKATGHNTVSLGGPILCRDQIEEWSAAEANLFEDALEKYGKDFSDVRTDFVYIPNHTKSAGPPVRGSDPCEGCKTTDSSIWHAWGPSNLQLRLCQDCWIYWKKYGGLKERHEYDGFDMNCSSSDESTAANHDTSKSSATNVNPLAINKSSMAAQNRPAGPGHVIARLPSNHPLLLAATSGSCVTSSTSSKTKQLKAPFTMRPSMMYKVARRVCPKSLLNLRFAARRPTHEISLTAVKNYCYSLEAGNAVLSTATQLCQIHNRTLPSTFAQNYTLQAAQHHQQQQQQTLKRPPNSVASEPCAKREKLQVGSVAIAAARSPSSTAMLSPKPSKWDSVWRWQPGGQFVFLAGPLFRRKRTELLPRETLGHQIGRRALIAKETDIRVANHIKALMQFLPPMPSENPPRRLSSHQVQARIF
ncbi:BAH domain protein [Dictyocaulus viviparus]|uniref:BAH domain protein n=1 Tax=Dictyocaulus viviparus TaxID=29172 RepID=A0A0D8XFE7_DICVI|nr:BAH domain protein [Dictyocaulus viviparus]